MDIEVRLMDGNGEMLSDATKCSQIESSIRMDIDAGLGLPRLKEWVDDCDEEMDCNWVVCGITRVLHLGEDRNVIIILQPEIL